MSRRYKATLFDVKNVQSCCVYCNKYLSGNQYVFSKKLNEKYGNKTAESLYRLSQTSKTFSQEELQQLLTTCKQFVKLYQKAL